MNAHSLLEVPPARLSNGQNAPAKTEPDSPAVAGPVKPGLNRTPAKISYLPSVLDWSQGVSHWGLND